MPHPLSRSAAVFFCSLALLACEPPLGAQDGPAIGYVDAFPGQKFARPLYLEFHPDDLAHCYVVEQTGKVWRVPRDGGEQRSLFLDLGERALHPDNGGHNEEGLLGFAFDPALDPDTAENRRVWVYYSEKSGEESVTDRRGRTRTQPLRRSVVAHLPVDVGDAEDKAGRVWVADLASEARVLEVDQPWGNHNGGTIVFGPDRMLYIALGDGGARADQGGHGQNLATLLATVLRIDVSRTSAAEPYAIPADNPFVGREGARAEIFAYGLRNPWRISFDRETGDLWCGDVGQDLYEEVDRIVAGGNYGWPLREGFHEFPPKRDDSADPMGEFVEPVAEYPRNEGISVTGGYVYRGKAIPGLVGRYVYGDFASTRMWAVREDREGGAHDVVELARCKAPIASFAEWPDGELGVICFDGKIYRIVPTAE